MIYRKDETTGLILNRAEMSITRDYNPDGMIPGAVIVFHQVLGVTLQELEDFVDGTPQAEAAMRQIAEMIRSKKK